MVFDLHLVSQLPLQYYSQLILYTLTANPIHDCIGCAVQGNHSIWNHGHMNYMLYY